MTPTLEKRPRDEAQSLRNDLVPWFHSLEMCYGDVTTAPSGNAGIVYEACQVSLNRQVALKVISGSLGLSITILSFLFGGGPPPAAPGPTTEPCGSDPDEGSPGDLDCNEYASC